MDILSLYSVELRKIINRFIVLIGRAALLKRVAFFVMFRMKNSFDIINSIYLLSIELNIFNRLSLLKQTK